MMKKFYVYWGSPYEEYGAHFSSEEEARTYAHRLLEEEYPPFSPFLVELWLPNGEMEVIYPN